MVTPVSKTRVRVTVELDRRDWDRLSAYVERRNAEPREDGETPYTPEVMIVAAVQLRLDEVERFEKAKGPRT